MSHLAVFMIFYDNTFFYGMWFWGKSLSSSTSQTCISG